MARGENRAKPHVSLLAAVLSARRPENSIVVDHSMTSGRRVEGGDDKLTGLGLCRDARRMGCFLRPS
jgi:hypothetical protein